MDHRKGAPEDFVTVVSVGGRPVAATENFVTVLSIGSAARKAVDVVAPTDAAQEPSSSPPPLPPMLEEEVQVFRLPGERLGFGLKFEGGNKTSELVRRLFVQSCAEQSPASRAVCSWGSLGEGDEIMSIDDVPVARMTRLDCVRRLKESQLMIKLVVRCRGALRPEVISAELKTSPERGEAPPELPGVPPPVPPRKLRQARGSADGEANPGPAKKCRDAPNGTTIYCGSSGTVSENSYETCESSSPGNSANGSKNESPKGSPKERSPELTKSKQEPPEAMVYLDARSQDGSSTHGSTSDDTGSSMSTVVDKFSTSDRFSTISTASTASTASVEQQGDVSRNEPVFLFVDRRYGKPARTKDVKVDVNAIRLEGGPFEHHLDREEFPSTPPDSYLLTRLANSEAATYVDSLGEGGIVERVTAVVAPNTVVIEETITLQPPLSFQDAPLSYGHETRPGLFYDDLAADSATHFRPIKDDASIVERVNGRDDALAKVCAPRKIPPPLPARNHVNRICVSRENECNDAVAASVPVLPPKPLPRKEAKARRKRPPPPPPPLPPPPPPTSLQSTTTSPARVADAPAEDSVETRDEETRQSGGRVTLVDLRQDAEPISPAGEDRRIDKDAEAVPVSFINAEKPANELVATVVVASGNQDVDPRKTITEEGTTRNLSPLPEDARTISEDTANTVVSERTNKVLEIIEMKKAKALSPSKNFVGAYASVEIDVSPTKEIHSPERSEDREASEPRKTEKDETSARMSSESGVDDSAQRNANESAREDESKQRVKLDSPTKEDEAVEDDSERRESERCILNGENEGEDRGEDEDTTDESDGDDYYWQSNLATIGEEEEINSLEYTNANDQVTADPEPKIVAAKERQPSRGSSPTSEDPSVGTNPVDGRMESCVGGQRLPPDGDEFPAAYQEFSAAQQYQFVTGSRTMTTTTTTTLMMTTKGAGESRVFAAGEAFELLPDDEPDSGGKTLGKAIPLPDGPVVEEGAEEISETSATVDRRKHRPPEVDKIVLLAVDPPVASNRCDSTRDESSQDRVDASIRPTVVVSEKKIEIAGYYRKDATPVAEPPKDAEGDEPPPPLPSTRPPRMSPRETITAKSEQPLAPQLSQHGSQFSRQPQRKFSSNVGDSWRQDDRSEKSVRDKIAMFSSRSSAEAPLFPSAVPCVSVGRLSKYRSSEDVVFLEEEGRADRRDCGGTRGVAEKTRSSLDLTSLGPQPAADASVAPPWKSTRKANVSAYGSRSFDDDRLEESPPAYPPKSAPPPVPRKSVVVVEVPPRPEPKTTGPPSAPEPTPKSPFRLVAAGNDHVATSPRTFPPTDVTAVGIYSPASSSVVTSPTKTTSPTSLTRATSFSGGNACLHERSRSLCDLPPPSRVARTNSLASAFKRPGEEARISNLNQLIEQRRRGMSKLRGLVIPEKETLPITAQPIVDLPEIKSRDSILHQMPKVCIQDKWGSQSSLASNASTASVPAKTTHTFKMPAPQILPKYSPAFKRKSLAVYGTNGSASASAGNCSPTKTTASPTSGLTSDAPKSLESICSPTRSDYSFEFASSSGSPDASRSSGLRVPQRKGGAEYDDSDNDSAVSSSQSSISRGFSPPASPVPSERSTISSSERSYLPTESYRRDSSLLDSSLVVAGHRAERGRRQYAPRPSMLGSERSSSSGSSVQNPSELGQPRIERQPTLQRSSSTDTNCSSSSTLTSGSQASGESLSRRVLKPQSVEAINRKNILASARCRSGRDLNGSPLIQRKFSDEDEDDDGNEAKPMSKLAQENGSYVGVRRASNGRATIDQRNTKIAYIEIAENFPEEGARRSADAEIVTQPEECAIAATRRRSSAQLDPTATEIETRPEPSNDLRTWVRAEAKALADSEAEKTRSTPRGSPPGGSSQIQTSVLPAGTRNGKIATDRDAVVDSNVPELAKPRSRSSLVSTKSEDERPGDLLTVLATRSRSRSAIHVAEDGGGATKSRASLEDILAGRTNASDRFAGNGVATEARQVRRVNSIDSWTGVDGPRPYGSRNVAASFQDRTRVNGDEDSEGQTKRDLSKIPTALGKTSTLGRRSVSVTDMKKAFEKAEVPTSPGNQPHFGTPTHNRFPSLDSSVEENSRASVATEAAEPDRYCGEQFGSISSLASSTSLISQQELAQLVEEASLLEESKGAHDVIVVLLHKENPTGSVGIALAGGVDCEAKEITVHRVLAHSIADKDGRVQRGDRILSINGRSTRGLSHRDSVTVLKQPRSEVVLVVSRNRDDDGCKLRSRTESVETIVEGSEVNGSAEDSTAWGPPSTVAIFKGGAGLGFSLEGGRDSPLGDKPLVIKKIFTGGAAEKTGALKAGDQLLEVNGNDVTRMSRIEAWSFMKKIHDGEVNLLVRHPATKSS